MRARICVVERPEIMESRTTFPPQLFTSVLPTISSSSYSPPLARTSGLTARIVGSEVVAAKIVTAETARKARSKRARASCW